MQPEVGLQAALMSVAFSCISKPDSQQDAVRTACASEFLVPEEMRSCPAGSVLCGLLWLKGGGGFQSGSL